MSGRAPDPGWQFSTTRASQLGRSIDSSGPPWTQPGLAAVMSDQVDPATAEDIAGQILLAFPREPVDRAGALIGFLSTLRPITPAVVADFSTTAMQPLSRWSGLPPIENQDDLARLVNLRPAELAWFADHRHWLRSQTGPLQHYRVRQLPKRDGVRLLEIPKPRMRELQRTVLHRVLDAVPPHPAAHGFRRGRSGTTFAAPHSGVAVVLRIDLRDFFPRVTVARVRAVFATIGYPPPVAAALADLCTTSTPIAALAGIHPSTAGLLRSRHLPQGSPTSPALSNLVLRNVDRRISGYAANRGLVYTRYADDLALSGDRMAIERTQWVVSRIVADEGFPHHPAKVRVMRSHQRQQLAGLVTNAHPQASRGDYDLLRALLHNAINTGAAAQNRRGHPEFRAHIYGRIAWIGATNSTRRNALLELAGQVRWDH